MLGCGRRPEEAGVCQSSGSSDSDSEDTGQTDMESESAEEKDMQQGESWVQWIQRTTYIVEEQLKSTGLDDWVILQRRRQWSFAGHVARRTDGRWSTLVLDWQPHGGARTRGRPFKRWGDSLDLFFQKLFGSPRHFWILFAKDQAAWRRLEDDYAYQTHLV